jgi:hypothetical protein
VIEYQTIKLAPPALLLVDCPRPEPLDDTASNLDVLNYTLDLQAALESCRQDKAGLRKFYEFYAD